MLSVLVIAQDNSSGQMHITILSVLVLGLVLTCAHHCSLFQEQDSSPDHLSGLQCAGLPQHQARTPSEWGWGYNCKEGVV